MEGTSLTSSKIHPLPVCTKGYTIVIPSGNESHTRKLRLGYGDFVWGIFNMEAEAAAQLEQALRVNDARTKDF